MYVASSRAKHELYIFVELTDHVEVIKSALKVIRSTNTSIIDPFQLLEKYAKTLGATFE